jgi:Protein of unknown function (DUF3574)
MTNRLIAFVGVLIGLLTAAPSRADTTAQMQGDTARPPAAQWIRSELYFGIGYAEAPKEEAAKAEATWSAFVDTEVTPRFPDGLSVFDVYGQWLDRAKARVGRIRTKVLVILHEDTAENRAKIDAIRVAWKKKTADQSVLWVTEKVGVSF